MTAPKSERTKRRKLVQIIRRFVAGTRMLGHLAECPARESKSATCIRRCGWVAFIREAQRAIGDDPDNLPVFEVDDRLTRLQRSAPPESFVFERVLPGFDKATALGRLADVMGGGFQIRTVASAARPLVGFYRHGPCSCGSNSWTIGKRDSQITCVMCKTVWDWYASMMAWLQVAKKPARPMRMSEAAPPENLGQCRRCPKHARRPGGFCDQCERIAGELGAGEG